MDNLLKICGVFVFVCLVNAAYAQVPEGIVTESGAQVVTEPEDSSVTTESDFMNGIVEHKLIKESRLLPYDNPRDADVPWSKKIWRIIDARQKINAPFSYRKKPLVSILLEEVEKGNIVAFIDQDFKLAQTYEEIMSKLNLRDTVKRVDPETQTEVWVPVVNEFNPELIKKYRVKEVWYFDKETSRMRVRVLGISPVRIVLDDNGNFLREVPMFWVNFNQAREYLNDYPVFNAFNDSATMSWADMFDARKFASFIYKTTNVRDTRLDIKYEKNPIEMLYASREIEERLFNMEQDFWSY